MDDEKKATQLRLKALMLERTNPGEGLEKLKQIAKEYRKSWTVGHLVLDDIIRIARESEKWDDAIEACVLGQELRPDRADGFAAEVEACELDRQGKHIEAAEVRLASTIKQGEKSRTLSWSGATFARLGARDRAMELFSRAIELAKQEQAATHPIRRKMADILIAEGKPREAVETLLTTVRETYDQNDEVPKVLVVAMRKGLQAVGFDRESGERNELADELIALCWDENKEEALERFSKAVEGLDAKKVA